MNIRQYRVINTADIPVSDPNICDILSPFVSDLNLYDMLLPFVSDPNL